MKLEHFGMPEPGDCRVVFSASAEELEAAVQAEQAAPDAPKEEEDLLTAAVNRAILEGFSPLFAQLMEEHRLVPVTDRTLSCWPSTGPKGSGRGRSSSACRRWSWGGTPALCSPSGPGLSGN